MKIEYRVNKELSVQTEYETDFSQKSTELKQLLESAILMGNMDLVRKVAAIAEQNKDLKIIFDEEVDIQKLYIASTITSFVETAIKHGLPKDVAETTKKKYYLMIAKCSSTTELVGYYFHSVEELITEINQYSMKQFSPIVKMAIEYIHNNKFQFLYAKDVAKAINVNRSYLSKKFGEDTGQTLTDYIHKVKMDFVIQLMESNFYKFNEIAELLGYANYAYFSKVFKKFNNETPVTYSKRLSRRK